MSRNEEEQTALTSEEEQLLQHLRTLAQRLGRTPTKKECSFSGRLKRYFGPWGRVCQAAGLPKTSDPAQVKLRERSRKTFFD